MKSLLLGVLIFVIAIYAPITLVVLLVIWILQQRHDEKIQSMYQEQRFVIEMPEQPATPSDPSEIDLSDAGDNVVRFPKR